MLLMEGSAGQVVQEGLSGLAQGSLQRSGLSGTQRVQYSKQTSGANAGSSAGSHSGTLGFKGSSSSISTTPASHKVIVKEKRVVTSHDVSQ